MSFIRPVSLVLGVLVASSSFAATSSRDRITSSRSAPATTTVASAPTYSGPTTWGLGVWSSDFVTNGDSISALVSSGDNWIQPFFSVAGTAGAFEFNIGATYRVTVAGNARSGFHFAPGFAVGTVNQGGSKFAFSFMGLFGAHYAVFDRLILSFDGGPILSSVDGDLNFKIRPAGSVLGLSFHYLF